MTRNRLEEEFDGDIGIKGRAKTPAKRPRGRPRGTASEQAGTVQALDRGLSILEAIARDGSGTLTDLALGVGMPPSSAHRLLMTLEKHGFVEFEEQSQEWFVGVETFRVGSTFLRRTNLIEASRQTMRSLMEVTGETANLAVPDKGFVVFVSQVETHNPIRAFFRPGTRGHMHASGIGKALLSTMDRAGVEDLLEKTGLPSFTPMTLVTPENLFGDLEGCAERGWALDDEERYTGMRCVAAPIFNAYGEAVAGISVSGPAVRFPDATLAETGSRVRRAAAVVTQALGGDIAL